MAMKKPMQGMDPEDMKEAPETPGETPDAEDVAEGPETEGQDADASSESASEDKAEGGEQSEQGGEDKPNVSPEEQKIYDKVVTAAMKLIFTPQAIQVLVQKFNTGKDNISAAIGHTAAMTMLSIRGTFHNSGEEIPDDVLYAAGQEVIGDLCDVAIAAKIFDESKEDTIANAALFEAVRQWGLAMKSAGVITPEVGQQAQKDLAERGVQQQAPQQSAPAQQPPGPPAGGIVNQATGA